MSVGPIRRTEGSCARQSPPDEARVTGGFWAARRQVNAATSIAQGPRRLEAAGNLANLRAAAAPSSDAAREGFHGDFQFQDSDVHKWLEAACWQLADAPDAALADEVERLVALVAAAQEPDGYLQTYYQVGHPELRWRELGWGHELYCAGHLIQAAVAHHRATGRPELLAVATGFAAHIDEVLGPDGRLRGVCGHPGIETALVELFRETGERRWLDLAATLVDRRGHGLLDAGFDRGHDRSPGAAYWQDHLPVRRAETVTGHAVRQLYLLAGVVDVATETGDAELTAAAVRLWESMAATKTHLTGGVGSRYEGEAFGEPYELPPDRAYAETCAAIASIQFGWRLALLTGEARYSDLVERTLYNGFLAGVALDGDRWLYVNPLQVRPGHEERTGDQTVRRTPWFRCACCPPNVMRLLAALPTYAATGDADGLVLHQYATGSWAAGGGRVSVATDYPWDGRIDVTVVEAPADREWTLALRVPAWAGKVLLDGVALARPETGWLRLTRRWRPGQRITLDLPLTVRRTTPPPRVDALRGCLALERGPLVYCLEATDQPPGVDLADIVVPGDERPVAEHRAELLGGATVLRLTGRIAPPPPEGWWPYGPAAHEPPEPARTVPLLAIPYHLWANRSEGAMRVWLRAG
ncbi:glycoside hydrolase family 127 protein [Streptomyces sp. NBRC 109706]|uniref:glycoside hydrolase family 127 protein n=1 Tax=Streptomyces sp. NBRC 109706 TaxID=1550035 RepID=UPI0007841EEA|nr:beta-L-arabinofuranosidase domain-containing protein [Streptomyces sp. NBRC 109706]